MRSSLILIRQVNALKNLTLKRMSSMTDVIVDTVFQTTTGDLLPITNTLNIVDTQNLEKWPVFRVLNTNGKVLSESREPIIDKSTLLDMYENVVKIQTLDEIFYNAQRQGRISFYMQSSGEEAIHIGTASALKVSDVVLAQYREVGVLLWRGFSLQEAADQCFSNYDDYGKGRQMPIHYGSRKLNYHTISSPLSTQMPQASGAAYALKLSGKGNVSVCYFGEGAASEGDFHAALNFAATLDSPVIFICRNNGYAISTPTAEQYRGDGIASRAVGYGMLCIRVDGNDILALHEATTEARKIAIEFNRPVLIEAMTYRQGHHSTSDDSTRYRSEAEINHWHDHFDPVKRFRQYLESKKLWNESLELKLRDDMKLAVLGSLQSAEKKARPDLDTLFDDVYNSKPLNLIKQEIELKRHIEKYPEDY